jgi:PBSX family phage terminase large subunit
VRGETVLAGVQPTERQLDVARACLDPAVRVVVLDGAIRSGKTQAAARILLEWAVEQRATYLVGRSTYSSLKDSTEKALLFGDGGLPPLIPPELVAQYRAADELVRLRSGAEILFRSLEEGNLGKILNLSLAGVLVDQIEELDPGDAGERVFDTLLGRLSDPRGPRKLLAVANPAGLTSWQYRRLINEATRDPWVARVHFRLADNAQNLPADYLDSMEAMRETRPAWYRSFILGDWGAFAGQAFEEFDPAVHVVEPFEIPDSWERFESMDHGAHNPTCWLYWAVDYDGNLIVCDEYYSAGLVSRHATEILRRRRDSWQTDGWSNTCWADPSIFARHGLSDPRGSPASVMTEYAEFGIGLSPANHDRKAGYLRLCELLHVDPKRLRPSWAPARSADVGAPRLYVFTTCRHLIEQFKSAPVAAEGLDAGEIVDPRWATSHGHAIDSARYGAMSRPSPSDEPEREQTLEDPRAEALRQSYLHERELDEVRDFDAWEDSLYGS